MSKAVIYIHGKDGSSAEAEFYKSIFEDYDIIGLDYKSQTPWEAKEEFAKLIDEIIKKYDSVILIANSIGAFFTMNAMQNKKIEKAFFISPIVDMQKLIEDMMKWTNITEEELKKEGTIKTSFGEDLSWEYLLYVKNNKFSWKIPTHILYGEKDNLTSLETITKFVNMHDATLTIMGNGEHWFHTEEQMNFIRQWIEMYK